VLATHLMEECYARQGHMAHQQEMSVQELLDQGDGGWRLFIYGRFDWDWLPV
jgi:hypothetical protein